MELTDTKVRCKCDILVTVDQLDVVGIPGETADVNDNGLVVEGHHLEVELGHEVRAEVLFLVHGAVVEDVDLDVVGLALLGSVVQADLGRPEVPVLQVLVRDVVVEQVVDALVWVELEARVAPDHADVAARLELVAVQVEVLDLLQHQFDVHVGEAQGVRGRVRVVLLRCAAEVVLFAVEARGMGVRLSVIREFVFDQG